MESYLSRKKYTEWLVQVKEHGAFEELQVTKDFKGEKKTVRENGLFIEGLMFYFTFCPILSIHLFSALLSFFNPFITRLGSSGDHIHHFYFPAHFGPVSDPSSTEFKRTVDWQVATWCGHQDIASNVELCAGVWYITHLLESHVFFISVTSFTLIVLFLFLWTFFFYFFQEILILCYLLDMICFWIFSVSNLILSCNLILKIDFRYPLST